MNDGITARVKQILDSRTKNINLATHIMLAGFADLCPEDVLLDPALIETHSSRRELSVKPFTKLYSASASMAQKALIEAGKLNYVTLPVNDDYHLRFHVVEENMFLHLLYIDFKGPCRLLEPYRFPDIETHRSIDFSGNPESMDSIKKGRFAYDTHVWVREMTPDTIIEIYKGFRDFVEDTRLGR